MTAKFSYPACGCNQGRVLRPSSCANTCWRRAGCGNSGALDHIRIVASAVAQEEDSYYKEHRDEILDEIGNLEE